MKEYGTYVYALIAAPRKPALPRGAQTLAGAGPVRLLPVATGLWLVVADAPLDLYGEDAINRNLSDLDWVSRAAVAHETVVERFINMKALLPMKLFTIFRNDARALDNLRDRQAQIAAALKRVRDHQEWGLRVVLDRARATSGAGAMPAAKRAAASSGAGYLSRKKAQRDRTAALAAHAREAVDGLYDEIVKQATIARRRLGSELPVQGGPLLLDAVLLVRRTRAARLRATTSRAAKRLGADGYHVTLSGPWPPYSFMQD
jgi:hypothetical protein